MNHMACENKKVMVIHDSCFIGHHKSWITLIIFFIHGLSLVANYCLDGGTPYSEQFLLKRFSLKLLHAKFIENLEV